MKREMLSSGRENQIIATVNHIHQRVGFSLPPFPIHNFFQEFPGYQVKGARLPKGYDGELLCKGEEKIIRYRMESTMSSARFTIAHEIAHSFLHTDREFKCNIYKRSRLPENTKGRTKKFKHIEDEADFFARELLVPLPMLDRLARDLDELGEDELSEEVGRLAMLFFVSKQLMRSRLKELFEWRKWSEDNL